MPELRPVERSPIQTKQGLNGYEVECIPNFSEGRRPEIIEQIVAAIRSASVAILDQHMDAAHNRAVVTFAGNRESCLEAAFRAVRKAAELIDLNQHQGEHPRMGATDVCPFVPLNGVTEQDCVILAQRLAQRVAKELQIPVYLYELAANRPEREDLAEVRRGGFEKLREKIETDSGWVPDYGPCKLHPTAGAIAIGVRQPLIAYNINLTTENVEVAKKIAKSLRGRDGGLRYCKALGFSIPEKKCTQVSMNLTRYQSTGLFQVFEMVKREAARYGVGIAESEIVGLVPLPALIDALSGYLQLHSFSQGQILENALGKALEKHGENQQNCACCETVASL